MKKETFIKRVINIYTVLGFLFILAAIVSLATPIVPYIAYRLNPNETTNEIDTISETVSSTITTTTSTQSSLPAIDPTLPTDPYIVIPSIGVYSPISTISDYKEALKHGAWMVPNYGTPDNGSTPIIVAAHRFGYIYWDANTRVKISFYNLPKTKVGDTIEIIWGQRRYTYQIYAATEGKAITDYSANLILYTCKYFDSPIRYFRYAKLITP